ncbi:MAG TPA: hypothetical protein VEP68_01565 [Anaeromyxobacteraceae bacterium]|nr:hypothetical protein [Anaeromyxobacteraceae bacterium]
MRSLVPTLVLALALPGTAGRAAGPAPPDQPTGKAAASGHPRVPGAPSSQELLAQVEAMKAELQRRPKTVEIELALGNLYLANGRVLDAIDWYRQVLEDAAPWRRRWEAIPAAARAARPPEAARRDCLRSSRVGSREMAGLGQARLAAGDQAGGAHCLREALGPALEALARRGNAWFLAGNPDQAVADHREVLRLDPSRSDSLYFIGAILSDGAVDDLESLRRAREAWLELRRRDPRSPRLAEVAQALPALEARIAAGGTPPARGTPAPPGARGAGGLR